MRIALFLILTASAWAQAPADITVTLRADGGKTQFRLGEIVPVELVFASSARGTYRVWDVPTREIGGQEFDRFLVDPEEGATVFPRRRPGAYNGPGHEPILIYGSPAMVSLTLNDWVAFRKPGHYRITVETDRAVSGWPFMRVSLRSNSMEIDEVEPEPGWAEAQVESAAQDLAATTNLFSEISDTRVLRFLRTIEAARALVQFHLYGPPAVQYEVVLGLRESPFQEEIIKELEAAIAAPDSRITQPQQVRGTLNGLKAIGLIRRNQP